jgi:hypothetical protein
LKRLGLIRIEASHTRNGHHVEAIIEKDLDGKSIVVAQLLLGSDINREIYNFLHHLDGELPDQWNKLFDKKYLILDTRFKLISQEKFSSSFTSRLREIVYGHQSPTLSDEKAMPLSGSKTIRESQQPPPRGR